MNADVRRVRRWTLEFVAHGDDDSDAEPGLMPSEDVIDWRQPVSVDLFLRLYTRVGSQWHWYDRRLMPPERLQVLLEDPNRHVGVLRTADGVEAGLVELYRHCDNETEIVYFGLYPEHIGRGLGRRLFRQVVRTARRQISDVGRLWLTTCEWDSPTALPFYQRMGFRIVDEDVREQPVPEDFRADR
ncbi:MAG: GNAT family N-acetyltransferase [Fuerstiella sp.]